MIKYFIWDFDGVICNSVDLAFKTHNEICKEYKQLPQILSKHDYAKIIESGYDESLMRHLTKEELSDYFFKHREKIYEKRSELRLFPIVINEIKNN